MTKSELVKTSVLVNKYAQRVMCELQTFEMDETKSTTYLEKHLDDALTAMQLAAVHVRVLEKDVIGM